MAETNDPMAHFLSLNYLPDSITMLNGKRYNQRYRFQANQWFRIPANIWNNVKDNTNSASYKFADNSYTFLGLVQWYLKRHFHHQLPRILTLLRYYQGDNDIHYWKSNKIKRADNRIADNYPRFITDFYDGMFLGKPLNYGYQNAYNVNDDGHELLNLIDEFNSYNNNRHHDFQMGKDMLNTGRAYELEYVVPGTHAIKVKRINPNQCFVIWSTDVDSRELCAVRYTFQKIESQWDYQVEIYTDDKIYQYDAGSDLQSSNWTLESEIPNVLGSVPITEFTLNDDRMGKWEPELDDIDALDVTMSEMANSQEDFSNATAVISGAVKRPSRFVHYYNEKNQPLFYQYGYYRKMNHFTTSPTDGHGHHNRPVMVKRETPTDSNVLWLMPSTDASGHVQSQPTIKYLTKKLDVNEWKAYVDEIKSRIERFCGIPRIDSKQGIGGQQNEMAVMMRVLSAIENSFNFESNFRHGVIRRLELLVNYYTRYQVGFSSSTKLNDPDDISIHFNVNLPIDLQGTAQELQILAQTGRFSNHTIRVVGSKLTGVSADEETSLVNSENANSQAANDYSLNSAFQNEVQSAGMSNANPSNNVINKSDSNSSSSNADNHATPDELQSASQQESSDSSQSSSDSVQSSSFDVISSSDSSDSDSNSINNPFSDNSGSATSEIMDPNMGFGENGSAVSLNDSAADDMALAAVVLDSIYASGGYPSGFDSAMSSVVSQVASSSVSAAMVQSNSIDNAMMASMSDPTNSSSDQS